MSDIIRIPMFTDAYYAREYNLIYKSEYVYRVRGATHNPSSPHRIQVWDNTDRKNTQPGEWNAHTGRKNGTGAYIDPRGYDTDHETSVLMSAESSVITNTGTNTGTRASGQVYAEGSLSIGDRVQLVLPDGSESVVYVLTAVPMRDPILVSEW